MKVLLIFLICNKQLIILELSKIIIYTHQIVNYKSVSFLECRCQNLKNIDIKVIVQAVI